MNEHKENYLYRCEVCGEFEERYWEMTHYWDDGGEHHICLNCYQYTPLWENEGEEEGDNDKQIPF